MRAAARARAGSSGTLALVLLLTLVIGGATLAALEGSRGVHRRTAGEIAGLLAQAAAESAVEEAAHRIALGVNDTGSPIARIFRDLSSGAPVEIPAALTGDLPATRALLAAPPFDGRVTIEDVQVRIASHVPVHTGADRGYERVGTIVYEATARHGTAAALSKEPDVVRRVSVEQAFRVSLATVPRPFDKMAFFVGDAAPYLAPADQLLARSAQALLAPDPRWGRTWTQRNDALRDALDDALRQAEARGAAGYALAGMSRDAMLDALRSAVRTRTDVAAALDPLVARLRAMSENGRPHRFEDPSRGVSTRVVLMRAAPASIPLGSTGRGLDVAGWARPLAADLEARIAAVQDGDRELDRQLAASPTPDAVRRLSIESRERWLAASAAVTRALDRVASLQEDLEEYHAEEGPGAYRPLQSLLREKMLDGFLEQKVMWNVHPEGRETPADALARTWKIVDPSTETLNGIVRVHIAGSPLELSDRSPAFAGWKRGRAVLVVDGDCVIEDLARRPDALLVLIVRGKLTVRGRVTAGLIGLGEVKIAPGAKINGTLVLNHAPASLDGTLETDPRLSSGAGEIPDEAALLVALSPVRHRVAADRSAAPARGR